MSEREKGARLVRERFLLLLLLPMLATAPPLFFFFFLSETRTNLLNFFFLLLDELELEPFHPDLQCAFTLTALGGLHGTRTAPLRFANVPGFTFIGPGACFSSCKIIGAIFVVFFFFFFLGGGGGDGE